MSTVRAAFNISATIVKSLVKVAGFGFVADAIEGGQEIYQLACSLKDETFGSAEAQMGGALRNSITAELASIEDQLGRLGHNEKSIDLFIGRLETSAKRTIARLLDDENALSEAITKPKTFQSYVLKKSKPVRADYTPEEQEHLDALLHCVASEYLILAPKSPNYIETALKATVEELSKILTALEELKDGQQELKKGQQEIKNGQQQLKSSFESLRTTIENEHTIRHNKQLNNDVWGSRPATLKHWIERDPTSNGTSLHDTIFNSPSSQPGSRCVLVGRAGSGKTSLAASIASRCESDTWSLVAWIDASTRSNIESGLIALGEAILGTHTNVHQEQRLRIEQVLASFKRFGKNNCLFVYDNAEGLDYLDGVLPVGPGVHIVVTTRRKNGWSNQAGWIMFDIGNFSRAESIKHLLSVTEDIDLDTADKIASYLGDLPLAVTQAAATCSRYYSNLQDYYADLQATNIEELLEPIEGGHYSKGAIASLQLATHSALNFMKDPLVKKEAEDILAVLCYLAESGVPTKWLKYNNGLPSRKAFKLLQDASIIDQSNDGRITSIHRLLAHALRTLHDSHITNDGTLTTACLFDKINNTQSDKDKYTAGYRLQITHLLITQFRALGTQSYSKALFDHTQVVQCLFDTLRIAISSNLSSEAITLTEAFAAAETSPHTSPPQIARARNELARAHVMASRYFEAIAIYNKLVADLKNSLGREHSDTIEARIDLAYAYRGAKRYTEAIAIHNEIVTDLTPTLGPEHPSTIKARNNLANAYISAKQYTDAIATHKEIVTDLTHAFGLEDPDTIEARINLADAYIWAKKYADAIATHNEIVTDLTRTLGPEHPSTIKARNNLANAYEYAGDLTEAITLYQQTLTDSTRIHGEDDMRTMLVRFGLEAARRRLKQREDDSGVGHVVVCLGWG